MTTMYHAGQCRLCGDGLLGVRICCGRPLLMCDECDAVWLTPNVQSPPMFPAQPDLPCPTCGKSLRAPPSHWATDKELARNGWYRWVVGEQPVG